ncbi:hypothetical protein THAOC_32286 [Thalassiosira oceanica]|uniref:Secreted protein n=1 Tax=Thalassiosira oceanica TaxID=159749 RepID=K0RQA6_THAOC|nr:hypothetical protein THAOC_32286 [Thalassiosira oceanica]|eukprot:EJK48882.1 hypothetical protein THAOC_32286 [Thalassiosira oceanica]
MTRLRVHAALVWRRWGVVLGEAAQPSRTGLAGARSAPGGQSSIIRDSGGSALPPRNGRVRRLVRRAHCRDGGRGGKVRSPGAARRNKEVRMGRLARPKRRI